MPERNKKSSDDAQSQRFMETARELGCDEDEAAFEDKLRRIARQKPKSEGDEKPATKKPGQ